MEQQEQVSSALNRAREFQLFDPLANAKLTNGVIEAIITVVSALNAENQLARDANNPCLVRLNYRPAGVGGVTYFPKVEEGLTGAQIVLSRLIDGNASLQNIIDGWPAGAGQLRLVRAPEAGEQILAEIQRNFGVQLDLKAPLKNEIKKAVSRPNDAPTSG
jgi:hypothetical protein